MTAALLLELYGLHPVVGKTPPVFIHLNRQTLEEAYVNGSSVTTWWDYI